MQHNYHFNHVLLIIFMKNGTVIWWLLCKKQLMKLFARVSLCTLLYLYLSMYVCICICMRLCFLLLHTSFNHGFPSSSLSISHFFPSEFPAIHLTSSWSPPLLTPPSLSSRCLLRLSLCVLGFLISFHIVVVDQKLTKKTLFLAGKLKVIGDSSFNLILFRVTCYACCALHITYQSSWISFWFFVLLTLFNLLSLLSGNLVI